MNETEMQSSLQGTVQWAALVVLLLLSSLVVNATASVAAARSTCAVHPTWHYHDAGIITAALCEPPEER